MTPGISSYIEPEKKIMFQQGYKEGYEAGKTAALKQLKYAQKNIEVLDPYSTGTDHYQIIK